MDAQQLLDEGDMKEPQCEGVDAALVGVEPQ
jgi:hypothetical protein